MDQEVEKFPDDVVLLLSIKKETSHEAEQSVFREMRHRVSIQRISRRHNPGAFVFYPSRFVLCAFFLCLCFPFPPNFYLLIYSKYFRILFLPHAFSILWTSPFSQQGLDMT